jgi:hypothetical protein
MAFLLDPWSRLGDWGAVMHPAISFQKVSDVFSLLVRKVPSLPTSWLANAWRKMDVPKFTARLTNGRGFAIGT